jgi:uncharacterized protein
LGDRSFSFYNLLLPPVIQVFAKAPRPGRVKTRLLSRLTPMEASELHWALVADTLDSVSQLSGAAAVEIYTDLPTDAWAGWQVPSKLQRAGDLGARMRHSMGAALADGRPKALVVGADTPALPPAAVANLLALDVDVALGPAEDGGFYAICCRRIHPAMFRGVVWSTRETWGQAARAAAACGFTVAVGQPWRDLDTPADLDRLIQQGPVGAHLAAWLASAGMARR